MTLLYHAGVQAIPVPDIRHGRKNADFGQGFYLSPDGDFARRWAKERRGEKARVNEYALETDGLRIKRLSRNGEWFDYIFENRAGGVDRLAEYDVIVGPIANDTLYDTCGAITSGLLPREAVMAVLRAGPEYRQVAIKTERAAARLRWLGCRVVEREELLANRQIVAREEAAFQEMFARMLEEYEKPE